MQGILIKKEIGIGDGLQFSSLPENYFLATGKRLIDVSRPWFFDYNPYVDRYSTPEKSLELWNFGPQKYEWPRPRNFVYQSNAEIWASLLNVPVCLNRPRLYQYETMPYQDRTAILFHPFGRSHGALPKPVIEHVLRKYQNAQLFQIGNPTEPDLGIPRLHTPTLWALTKVISSAKLFIGVDSGPAWIAACFPDVIVKKIRVKSPHGEVELKDWVPLEINNIHSHWDDRLFQVFNITENDVGFTSSYLKL